LTDKLALDQAVSPHFVLVSNLHPLILYDGQKPGALEHAEKLAGEILRLCIRLGGSITGEHGVGMEKRRYLPELYDAVSVETMRAIQRRIDPQEIANPGKMFPAGQAAPGSE
jgi:glycolate oxidase